MTIKVLVRQMYLRSGAHRVLLVVLGSLVVLAWLADIARELSSCRIWWMDDALSYASAGRHLMAATPLYAPFQLAGEYPLGDAAWGAGFVYPPTAAVLFAPFATLDMSALGLVFTALLLLLGWLTYIVGRQQLERGAALALAAVVCTSAPALNAWDSGNANLLVACALLASWIWDSSSGPLAVGGALIKIYPIVGLAWAFRRRRPVWRPIAVGMAVVVVATLLVGVGGWTDFLTATMNGRSFSWYWLPSPTQLLGPVGRILALGLTGLAVIGVIRLRDDRLAFACLGISGILLAPDWWAHYLLVPLVGILPWCCAMLAALAPQMARRLDRDIA